MTNALNWLVVKPPASRANIDQVVGEGGPFTRPRSSCMAPSAVWMDELTFKQSDRQPFRNTQVGLR